MTGHADTPSLTSIIRQCYTLPMQKRADFYILATQEVIPFALKVIEKAFKDGLRIHVLTQNTEQAKQFDVQLWTFKNTSFIPHALAEQNSDAPIQISDQLPHDDRFDALINLQSSPLPDASRWQRILEIVSSNPTDQQLARERFKQYRSSGFELHTHKIGN